MSFSPKGDLHWQTAIISPVNGCTWTTCEFSLGGTELPNKALIVYLKFY